MDYGLTTPCKACPFKTKTMPYISTARAREITEGIMNDATFVCHKTMDTKNEKHCAGALIFLEKQNNPNQMMRISQRFGDYDPSCLDKEVSIYDTPEDMVNAIGIWNGDIEIEGYAEKMNRFSLSIKKIKFSELYDEWELYAEAHNGFDCWLATELVSARKKNDALNYLYYDLVKEIQKSNRYKASLEIVGGLAGNPSAKEGCRLICKEVNRALMRVVNDKQ